MILLGDIPLFKLVLEIFQNLSYQIILTDFGKLSFLFVEQRFVSVFDHMLSPLAVHSLIDFSPVAAIILSLF